MFGQHVASKKAAAVRRGRAAVLWAAVAFVCLQAGYHYPFSSWCPEIHDPEYARKERRLHTLFQEKSPGRPFIVGLGSSFTAMGLRPTELRQFAPRNPDGPIVYNFAMNGCGVVVQYICLQRLLADGQRPDWVLIEACPHLLFDGTNQNDNAQFIAVSRVKRPDLALLARYTANPHQMRVQWRAVQFSPWLSHRHPIQNWLLPDWVPDGKRVDHMWSHTDEWGWELFPEYIEKAKLFYRTPKFESDVRRLLDGLDKVELSKEVRHAYDDLIALCRQEKINVAVIRMPESTHYRLGYGDRLKRDFANFYAHLNAIATVPVVDASDWVEDGDFLDGGHLAPSGATVYTRRLERELLLPIARGTSLSKA